MKVEQEVKEEGDQLTLERRGALMVTNATMHQIHAQQSN